MRDWPNTNYKYKTIFLRQLGVWIGSFLDIICGSIAFFTFTTINPWWAVDFRVKWLRYMVDRNKKARLFYENKF